MRKNRALARLREGKVAFGMHIGFASPDLAEQAAHAGFDWVWLDGQHGEWTEPLLNQAIARFLGADAEPIVRVAGQDPAPINRALDMGAMGVMVPMVENVDQARAAVGAAYYPPLGRRSAGGPRLGLISGSDPDAYWAGANDQMMLIVQIETEEAVANIVEIMEVPGVDAALIGPGDLMIDVKARGHDEAHHERLVQQVVEASRRTGIPAGYYCVDLETARKRVLDGFRLIGCGTLTVAIRHAMQEAVKASRNW